MEKQREKFDLVVVKLNLEYKSLARMDDLIDAYMATTIIGSNSLIKVSEIYQVCAQTLLWTGEIVSVNFDQKIGKSRGISNRIRNIKKTRRISLAR